MSGLFQMPFRFFGFVHPLGQIGCVESHSRPDRVIVRDRALAVQDLVHYFLARAGLRFCFVFLTIAALSFLGLGIQPPLADWGSMVRDTATLITFGDITPLVPAAAIALLTISVNFVVDWMLYKASGLTDRH